MLNYSHSESYVAGSGRYSAYQNAALYFYAFSLNLESLDPFGTHGFFSLAKFAGILYLALLSLSYSKFFVLNRRAFYYVWPVFVFFVIYTVNSIANINYLSADFFDSSFLLNVIMFVVIINHGMRDLQVMNMAMYFFALSAVIVVFLIFLGVGVTEGNTGRMSFFGANVNEFGIKSSAAFVIILNLYHKKVLKSGLLRITSLTFAPFLILGIVNTGSRSAAVSLVLGILFSVLFFKDQRLFSRIMVYGLAAGAAAFSIFLVQNSEMFMKRIAMVLVEDAAQDRLGGRQRIWEAYWILIKEYWFLGLGKTGFEYHAIKLIGAARGAHNVIIEAVLYTGVVGLSLYLLFLFRTIQAAWRCYKKYKTELPILLIPSVFVTIAANQALNVKFAWLALAYMIVTYLYQCLLIKYLKQKLLIFQG